MQTKGQKQRKYPRHKAPKGMCVAWKSGRHRMVSRAEVVGMGGVFLHTPNPLPLGTMVDLLFTLTTGEVHARAMVRNVVPGQGMGVQFVQMEPTDRARLDQFLSRYAAKQAALSQQ